MKPTVSDIIRVYVTLRNQKNTIEAEMKEQLVDLKTKMGKLEAALKVQMEQQGLTSLKSDYGTAFMVTVDYATVGDWDAVLKFVRDNEAYDMLERRVSKTAVRGYIEANKAVPPGVTYGTRLEVNIRKSSINQGASQ